MNNLQKVLMDSGTVASIIYNSSICTNEFNNKHFPQINAQRWLDRFRRRTKLKLNLNFQSKFYGSHFCTMSCNQPKEQLQCNVWPRFTTGTWKLDFQTTLLDAKKYQDTHEFNYL